MSTATGLTRVPSSVNGPSTSIGWASAMAPSPRSTARTRPGGGSDRAPRTGRCRRGRRSGPRRRYSCRLSPPSRRWCRALARRCRHRWRSSARSLPRSCHRCHRSRRPIGRRAARPGSSRGMTAVTLTSDAPRRMPATATATARSVPSRHRSERVGVAAGRSATTVRSRAGTSRDAATTVEQPFRTWPAAARPRAFTAVAVAIRGGDGRCRRPRTRWTPTVALSNTVSWKWTVPQRLGSRRGWGSHVGPSGSRYRAGVSPRGRNPVDAGLRHQGEP